MGLSEFNPQLMNCFILGVFHPFLQFCIFSFFFFFYSPPEMPILPLPLQLLSSHDWIDPFCSLSPSCAAAPRVPGEEHNQHAHRRNGLNGHGSLRFTSRVRPLLPNHCPGWVSYSFSFFRFGGTMHPWRKISIRIELTDPYTCFFSLYMVGLIRMLRLDCRSRFLSS